MSTRAECMAAHPASIRPTAIEARRHALNHEHTLTTTLARYLLARASRFTRGK